MVAFRIRLACLAALAAACVPRGDPPAGRQLVGDRTSRLVGIVRPNGDGVTRVLVTRPGQAPQSFDLFVVSADTTGTPPSERLLAAKLPPNNVDCRLGAGECFHTDARGRLFVTTSYDPNTGFSTAARIDPVTGDRLDLAGSPYFNLSPSGERMLTFSALRDADATLYEADDRAIPLGPTTSGTFVGEDLYYLTAQQEVKRLVPGGAPEVLATGVTSFGPQTNQGDLLLTLIRSSPDPMAVASYSILDAVTLEETPSPFGPTPFNMSPDGRWLFAVDYAIGRVTFIERTTGVEDVFAPTAFEGSYEWRPGHDEVWFLGGQYSQPTTWVKKPGGSAVEIPGRAFPYPDESGHGSYFTRDGAYWFSWHGPAGERPTLEVGSADDPAGVRFDLTPISANSDAYWRLADGRILTPAWINDPFRTDIYSVDPATGDSRPLGEHGVVLAVGQTRLLTCLHVIDSRGDLTATDLGTGRPTVLAPEFTMAAFVERQGADQVAPGAGVAFQFQARFDSPYDGIWLATVP